MEVLICLIDLHSVTAPSTNTPPSTVRAVTPEKIQRPVISTAGTSEKWAYFVQRWSDYKNATQLDDNDAVFQLLESCDENLRKNLTRTFRALASTHEQTVLRNIKSLAEKTLWLHVCNYNVSARTETNQSESSLLVYECLQFQSGMPFSLV